MADTLMPTDKDIAEAAYKILKEEKSPIYLSRLGQDLRKEFATSFKPALGARSLGDFVSEHLGDKYEVWGKGPYKRVGVIGSAAEDDILKPRQKFKDAVWEAFSTPLPDGHLRWIDIGPPLAVLHNAERPSDSAVGIASEFIILDSLPRQRASEITASIRRWAETHAVASDALQDDMPVKKSVSANRETTPLEGLEALRRMISVIPEGERSQYSLPMNLLGRLLLVR